MAKRRQVEEVSFASLLPIGGAEGYVTGSMNRLKIGKLGEMFLIDCGLRQGRYDTRKDVYGHDPNRRVLLESPDLVAGVIGVAFTHAHADHIAGGPALIAAGKGNIRAHMSQETALFIRTMLENSAEIQLRMGDDGLYGDTEVNGLLKHIETIRENKPRIIGNKGSDVELTGVYNGHMPGSMAFMVKDGKGDHTIVFSGDVGPRAHALCGGFEDFIGEYPKNPVRTIVMESTSFGVEPVSFDDKKSMLLQELRDTWAHGGNPLMPVLSLNRAEEVIEMIHHFQLDGDIPDDVNIYLDGPLAVEILKIYKDLAKYGLNPRYGNDPEFYKSPKESGARFDLKNLRIVESHQESVANDSRLAFTKTEKCIYLVGGGMGKGRVNNFSDGLFGTNPNNKFIFTNFLVTGTPGARWYLQGMIGNGNEVGAYVVRVPGFGSHICDPNDFRAWIEAWNVSQLERLIINHGSDIARRKFAEAASGWNLGCEIILPANGQVLSV